MIKYFTIIFLLSNLLISAPQKQASYWEVSANYTTNFSNDNCTPIHFPGGTGKQHSISSIYSNPNGEFVVKYFNYQFTFSDGQKIVSPLKSLYQNMMGTSQYNISQSYIIPKYGTNKLYFIEMVNKWKGSNAFQNIFITELDTNTRTFSTPYSLFPDFRSSDYVIIENQNEDGYWILTSDSTSKYIESYHLTNNGIIDTIKSQPASFDTHNLQFYGYTTSPSGKKICIKTYKTIRIFDFDRTTGKIDNEITFNSPRFPRNGCQFSNDDSKLYLNLDYYNLSNNTNGTSFVQFDLSSNDSATIENSMKELVLIDRTQYQVACDILIAPNGRMYFTLPRVVESVNGVTDTIDYLGEIECPNLKYPFCNANPRAFKITTGYNLHRFPSTWFQLKNIIGENDTKNYSVCKGSDLQLANEKLYCTNSFWILPDNSTVSEDTLNLTNISIEDTGQYVYKRFLCEDSISIIYNINLVEDINYTITSDTINTCFYDSVLVKISPTPQAIKWSNGSEEFETYYKNAGNHSATITSNSCTYYQDFEIELLSEFNFDLEIDNDIICFNDSTLVSVNGILDSVLWSNGEKGNSIFINKAGEYSVTGYLNGCKLTKDFKIDARLSDEFLKQDDDILITSVCTNNIESTYIYKLQNANNSDVTLKSIEIIGSNAINLNPTISFPKLIEPNEEIDIEILVDGMNNNTHFNKLILDFEECDFSKTISITTEFSVVSSTFMAPDVIAETGSKTLIPINIYTQCLFLPENEQYIDLDIEYNRFLFSLTEVIDATLLNRSSIGNKEILNIRIPHILAPDSINLHHVAYLKGVVLLGQDTLTPIEIRPINEIEKSFVSNGSLNAEGVCAFNFRIISALYPIIFNTILNESTNTLEVEYAGGFEEGYSIDIYNIYGDNIFSTKLNYQDIPKDNLKLDMTNFSSGIYLIKFQNGFYVDSHKILKLN